jgi:hypothetical protein
VIEEDSEVGSPYGSDAGDFSEEGRRVSSINAKFELAKPTARAEG